MSVIGRGGKLNRNMSKPVLNNVVNGSKSINIISTRSYEQWI
jgi:hypothetical protein